MNIKEIKANYEKAARIVVQGMLNAGVKVEVGYNIENSQMNVNLISENDGRSENEKVTVIYNVSYAEENKMLSVAAIARHVLTDHFGASNIVYEPIFVDDNFMSNIKQGIQTALEHSDEIIKADEANKTSEAADATEVEATAGSEADADSAVVRD